MDIMSSLNQVALLFIQLSGMWHVFAVDYRDMLVSRGGLVEFICNTSDRNVTQISWIKGGSSYTHSIFRNQTQSNFSSNRVTIDHNLPTKLSIIDAQPEDEGLYRCNVTDFFGLHTVKWNLIVSGNHKDIHSSRYLALTSVIGPLLCCTILVLIIYRGQWSRTADENLYNSNTMTWVLYHVPLGGEVTPPQPQSYAVYEDKSHRE